MVGRRLVKGEVGAWRRAAVTAALLWLWSATGAAAAPLAGTPCDRACLLQQADRFNADMLAHAPGKVPLAPGAAVRENTQPIPLEKSQWLDVKQILSKGVYADPEPGNVVEHVAALTQAGKAVYIGTRLQVRNGRITQVEINFDSSDHVNLKNLVPYDPLFGTLVPPAERSTRAELQRIVSTYFQGLTDHKPVEADYDPRCDRFHSGNRITHNGRNGIEDNSGDAGCYESNLGPKPWGPATETRLAVIDPERGIVVGYSILYYGNSDRRMQINEVFKILDGRIRMVDNIGLMEQGITTSGFTQ